MRAPRSRSSRAARSSIRARHAAAQVAQVGQQLARRLPAVHHEVAGQVTDAAAQRNAVGARVAAEDSDVAGGRADQVEQQPDRGRLAGAVGAEVPEHLARTHGQVEPIEAATLAVALGEALGEDRGAAGAPARRRSPRSVKPLKAP